MKNLHFQIVTPERILIDEEILSVTVPTVQGEITVLPQHIPMIALLRAGTLHVKKESGEELLAVSTGVIEIDGANVVILADTAERADELEEERIEKAREEARLLMEKRRGDVEGYAEAAAMLEREMARMKVIERYRRRKRGVSPQSLPHDA
ncbi:ATP synthase F1 subunit epsilon [Candidatus Peregrinibacteria bacterium CG_4_9_14_0_2_um_filter_53_11]|nr:MAG: ATP synthase F1 subunit epsilon [Candidatus Peregrinibacteria bacterium CG_4_9_14_0_2_um_filter_53_11]